MKNIKSHNVRCKDALPVIVDTTLRDGVQMPGVHLSDEQKCNIIDLLAAIGIAEMEIGCAARVEREGTFFRQISKMYDKVHFSVWCRARREDIASAKRCGVDTVHISFPVSPCHMKVLGVSPAMVLPDLRQLTKEACDNAARVTIGAQDATRAELPFLIEFIQTAHEAGAQRVRIADTVGIGIPRSISGLFRSIQNSCPGIETEFHGHNDFGLAMANAFTATEAGCDAVSVTVNGVGERAGNVALEEFVTAGIMLYQMQSDLDMSHLGNLCSSAGTAFGLDEMKTKAISGLNSFRHESGIHCHGQMKDRIAYQPFDPEVIGRRTQFNIGLQSGVSTVQAVMAEKGQPVGSFDARKILDAYHAQFQ